MSPRKGAQLFFVYVAAQTVSAFAVGMAAAMAFALANPERGAGFDAALMRAIALPTVAGSILFGGVAVFLVLRRWLREPDGRSDLAAAGVTRPRANHVSFAVLAGIALGFVHAHGVMAIFPPPSSVASSPFVQAWRVGGLPQAGVVLLTLALAPVVEEFVFRGAIFAGFRSQWPAVPAGAMVTALFVAVHLVDAAAWPASMISIALLGIATFIAREKTGSILPCIALHSAYNFVVVLVVYSALAR